MLKFETRDPIFTNNNLDQRIKFSCPLCSYLLKDAVQTSCGHWLCQDCAEDIFRKSSSPVCPRADCGEILKIGKEFFPDLFVRKQINEFQTRCRNHSNQCPWSGTLIEQLKHLETCIYEQQECPHCNEMFSRSKFIDHTKTCPKALVICPYVQFGCEVTKEMTTSECNKHLEDKVVTHSKIVAASLCIPKRIKSVIISDEQKERTDYKLFSALSGEPSKPQLPLDTYFNPSSHSDVKSLRKQLTSKERVKLQQDETILQINSSEKENEDRDFRIALIEKSSYSGTMVWKIPQFSQRMDDARTGKYISILSPPFYSGRYGYKMCLRLYILGDGIGKGSHMSLFFVLMKGEFDNISQWPFTHKVTFKLINQCGGRDAVDIFQPDPLSSSFQKPKTDMNIASGCPRFVSLNELMQNGFIVEDTIFIKVKVDVTTIKHP